MKKKRTLKKWVIVFLLLVSIGGIAFSSYYIFIWKKSIDENNDVREITNSYINLDDSRSSIDFDSLKNMNSDTVSYIKVNGTDIGYIVLKSDNNTYYLTHNFNKEYSVAGWIFADYRNKLDGTDKNIVIYGHNMRNGSMFGTLKNILNSSWYLDNNNYIIDYYSPDGKVEYEVFSIYTIEPEEYYINVDFSSDEEYDYFLKTIKARSIYNFNVSLSTEDDILTLSSCTTTGGNRIVLHAKKVK